MGDHRTTSKMTTHEGYRPVPNQFHPEEPNSSTQSSSDTSAEEQISHHDFRPGSNVDKNRNKQKSERKTTGTKRKAPGDPQELQKKQKLEKEPLPPAVEDDMAQKLQEELSALESELAMLDEKLDEKMGTTSVDDIDEELDDIVADLSDDDIDLADDVALDGSESRGIGKSRSRRVSRPNRQFSWFEVDNVIAPVQEKTVVPTVNQISPVMPSVAAAPPNQRNQAERKQARGRGNRSRVTNSGGRAARVAARRGRPSSRWRPVLPAHPFPRRGSSKTPVRQMKSGPDPLEACRRALKELMRHQYSWPFLEPVDVVALKIPDYHNIIQRPMDLGTIQYNLENGAYTTVNEFAEDVRLVWSNAMHYNPSNHDVHVMAKTLSDVFERKFQTLTERLSYSPGLKKQQLQAAIDSYKITQQNVENELMILEKKHEMEMKEMEDLSPPLRLKTEIEKTPMSYEEKVKFVNLVNFLDVKFMSGLVQLFREEKPAVLRVC